MKKSKPAAEPKLPVQEILTKPREFKNTIYTDWANHHLERTGVARVIEDLPKDICDGVLLADIVEFVCGKPVERIHRSPRTAKQKLHNLERCLQVLDANHVSLSDVTVQGLYRGELKCVLALFFQLSRFKQKEKDLIMTDNAKSTQKRCLRPPSSVGVARKSRSFNANDRNRVNLDVSSQSKSKPPTPVDDLPKSIVPPQKRTTTASVGASGWRSKSMNVKHTATTKLAAPKSVAPTLQTFKPDLSSRKTAAKQPANDHNTVPTSHTAKATGTSRLGSPSRIQPVAKKTQTSVGNGVAVKLRSDGSNKITLEKSAKATASAKPATKKTVLKSKSPQRSLDRPVSRTSTAAARSIPNTTSTESEPKSAKTGSKPTSVMTRLRKLGSPTSVPSSATTFKSRPVSATKTALKSVSPNSTMKKRAESCPPTSRLDTRIFSKQKQAFADPVAKTKPTRADLDKPSKHQPALKSVKSSIGKALRSKPADKNSPHSSPKKAGGANKGGRKAVGISKSEICPIIPMVTNADQPVEPIYTRSNDFTENFTAAVCEGVPRVHDDVIQAKLTSDDPKPTVQQQHFVKPVSISIAGSRDRPHKTAMVAPIMRQAVTMETAPIEKLEKSRRNDVASAKVEDATDLSTASSAETRKMAVKGIADLRQNMEATMNSLRNTQLRDNADTHRRISAQLDDDNFQVSGKCPITRSSVVYRSHHNLASNRAALQVSLANNICAPKMHPCETVAQPLDYRLSPGHYSSLQRTRSARYPRSSWGENYHNLGTNKKMVETSKQNGCPSKHAAVSSESERLKIRSWKENERSDDGASESSGNLSDFIEDLSTDEFSSNQSSPQHKMKSEKDHVERRSWSKLANRLSRSSMDIEGGGKSVKYLKRKSMAKTMSGLPSPAGSSIVGSRLASNEQNTSPCPSPSQHVASNSGITNSYRSLPRPGKTKFSEVKVPFSQTSGKSLTFKRSPSLQKLFGVGRSKQNNSTEVADDVTAVMSKTHVTFTPSSLTSTEASRLHPALASRVSEASRDPLSYLSLPRRHRAHLSVAITTEPMATSAAAMTWTPPKRPNANSAYSITPNDSTNPYMDLLNSPSLNIDNQESLDYAVPDLMKETDTELLSREVSDWPLPTLLTSSDIAASNPNVASGSNKPGVPPTAIKEPHDGAGHYRSSMMASTSSLHSNKQEDDQKLQPQIFSHVVEDSVGGVGTSFRDLTNDDTEFQERKQNTESRIKSNSSDGHSNSSAAILRKKNSGGSVTSINSAVTASSVGSTEDGLKKKKKHWFRESLKTAFGKRKSRTNLACDLEEESGIQCLREEDEESEMVAQLKEELLKKERKLTDIRLEALTSQHQLHQMQDAMHKMKNEIESLRQENERLNKLELDSELADAKANPTDSFTSFADPDSGPPSKDDRRLLVKIQLPDHMIHDDTDECTNQSVIGVCFIARSIGWLELDRKVQLVVQNFCQNVSPGSGLGLDMTSIGSYKIGEASREIDGESPDLLPCGYIIGNVDSLIVKLKDGNTHSCDSLAFELLMDRATVEQYVRLVLDHGRVMLSGPNGTGKSTLANRLAEHLVRINPKSPGSGKIVRLDLKHRSENEVIAYLQQLSEDCSKPESSGQSVPVVLVLDDLHRSSKLKEAIIPLLTTAAHSQLPYLIGVAEHDNNSGLELHQEFRWILCSNHAPPVLDYLGRTLRQSLCQWETTNSGRIDDVISRVVLWLPDCWKHVNRCIEVYNSADVTLGPRMFSSCPMSNQESLSWFTNLWNFSLVPYIISAVKQGSRRRRNPMEWIDPLDWVKESWPWTSSCNLLPIRSEDVASDLFSEPNSSPAPVSPSQPADPLLSMMLKLREAVSSCESDASHEEFYEKNLDKHLGDLSETLS